ncbi:MAG: hypothetical protein HFI34_12895 [Lachnospiraceae bacterium]|nr:hypothetical protein [Lachnospiraceae bacterium]
MCDYNKMKQLFLDFYNEMDTSDINERENLMMDPDLTEKQSNLMQQISNFMIKDEQRRAMQNQRYYYAGKNRL